MPPQRGRKLARAARRREERHKKASRSRRPPFCPPTGHFDGGDYAGVQLHREDEVRVNNYEAFMLEKARQVVTSVAIAGGGGRRELPRNRHVNASGTGIHGCQMRTRAVAAAGAAAGDDEVERAWPHVEEGEDDAYGADAEVFDWTETELAGFVRRLGGIDLLSTLSEADLRMLAEHLQPRDFAAGEAIITVGDPADGIYLIESGSAQAESESGGALGAPLEPGAKGYFGELALESDRARSATVRALVSPTCLLKLPHEICRRLRGNAGLRARLAARRRGFGRPRNQYQGVQGSQMTLSAVTPGAFGAADAATALRAIGVPENEKSRAEELTRAPDLATVGEHVDTSRPPPEANTETAAERAEAEAKRQLELIDSELRRRGVPAEGPGAEPDAEEPVPATREATEWSGACRVYSRSAGQWVEAEIKERSTDGLSFRVEWRPRQKVTQREARQWKCEKPPGKLASKWISVNSRHLKLPAGKAQWWSQLAKPGARTARPPVGAHLVRNAAGRKTRPKAESVRQAIDGQYFIGVAGGPDDSAAVVQSLQEQQDAAIDQILSREIIAPVVSESVLAPTSSMTARALADARQYDADGVLAGLAPSGGSGRYDDDLSESDYEEENAAEEDVAEGESPEKEALEDTEPDNAEAEEQKAPG